MVGGGWVKSTFVAESTDECARAVMVVTPHSSLFSFLFSMAMTAITGSVSSLSLSPECQSAWTLVSLFGEKLARYNGPGIPS